MQNDDEDDHLAATTTSGIVEDYDKVDQQDGDG